MIFVYVPGTTPVSASETTPAATASPPTGSIWTMPLASGRGVRIRERAERLARREVDDGVHREVVARVQRHAEVAGVVLLAPLDRAERWAGAPGRCSTSCPAPNSAPSWNVLRPVTVTAPSFRT